MEIICKTDAQTEVIRLKPNGDIIVRGELVSVDGDLYNTMINMIKDATITKSNAKKNISSKLQFLNPSGKEVFRMDNDKNYINDKEVSNQAIYSALNVWCGIGQ